MPLAADVTFDSKEPILQLEDVDSYLRAVDCFGNTIVLSFNDEATTAEAEKQWASSKFCIAISNHLGCNYADQRKPY